MLVIDDAQRLTGATLVTLGDLLARAPRLKILLVGQHDPQASGGGLAARVVVAQKPRQVHLPAMGPEGTKAYIEHRLNVAGRGGKELFSAGPLSAGLAHTGGAAATA